MGKLLEQLICYLKGHDFKVIGNNENYVVFACSKCGKIKVKKIVK